MSNREEKAPLSRRRLLTAGVAAGAAGLVTDKAMAQQAVAAKPDPLITEVQDWTRYLGPGVQAAPYGKPSPFEKSVVRRDVEWLTASRESSINFTPIHALDGIITPNGLCFERHHGGAAEIDPAKHRLMIHGMVDKPLVFTMDDLKRMPGRINKAYFLECAANGGMEWKGAQLNGCQFTHGMIHNLWYTGLPLRRILDEAGIRPKAKWVLAEGGDASVMTRSIPLDKMLDDCMVAWAMNGEALRAEQGYPLRLVVPGFEGNMWIKWLRRLEVGDQPWAQREETSKYTDLLANGTARRHTFVMDAKSIVTNPSPQMPLKHKGPNVITGLAWSGRGTVKRVDVTIDGGNNWTTARIDGPVMEKSLVRFYAEIDWDGREMLIQSRAMDSTGYVQPTKADLRKIRGANSTYHNNGIQTWLVHGNGEVENVEIS